LEPAPDGICRSVGPAYRITSQVVYAAAFVASLALRLWPAAPPPAVSSDAMRSFELGYFAAAEVWLCETNPRETGLARQLVVEIDQRATAIGIPDRDAVPCETTQGASLRRQMNVQESKFEILGEAAFELEGVKGALPAYLASIFADAKRSWKNPPDATDRIEIGLRSRDAKEIERQLFGQADLPLHPVITGLRSKGAP
jgi:hypothetical protein